jgi:enoyl-CoA hydratase/carnithine racemase
MSRFDTYRASFPNARLTRSKSGVLEVAFHTDGGTLVFDGHIHEQFVDLFHVIGSDPDNRVVILTGSGNAICVSITRAAVSHCCARARFRSPGGRPADQAKEHLPPNLYRPCHRERRALRLCLGGCRLWA